MENSDPVARTLWLIDKEIEETSSAMKRPGWTAWALLTSLATLAWLFSKELEQGKAQGEGRCTQGRVQRV